MKDSIMESDLQIEITPAMIEAGVSELSLWENGDRPSIIVESIYQRMASVSRGSHLHAEIAALRREVAELKSMIVPLTYKPPQDGIYNQPMRYQLEALGFKSR
jgi:hypothetical protein